eukprot:COSAG03_NODE_1200_length_4578_cov_7.366153_6_plen_55_part_00
MGFAAAHVTVSRVIEDLRLYGYVSNLCLPGAVRGDVSTSASPCAPTSQGKGMRW